MSASRPLSRSQPHQPPCRPQTPRSRQRRVTQSHVQASSLNVITSPGASAFSRMEPCRRFRPADNELVPSKCTSCQTPLVPGAIYCHMCGRRIRSARRAPKHAKILLAGGGILCLTAWLLVFAEVETVLGSGPIIFATGLATIVFSRRAGSTLGVLIGAAHCAICVLFTGLVNSLQWSPSDSLIPFATLGAAYCAAVLPLAVLAYRRMPEADDSDHCAKCGYLLTGLTEPRCPECGTTFDSAILGQTEYPAAPSLPNQESKTIDARR